MNKCIHINVSDFLFHRKISIIRFFCVKFFFVEFIVLCEAIFRIKVGQLFLNMLEVSIFFSNCYTLTETYVKCP